MGHRVAGIEGKVHDDLLHLYGINVDRSRIGGEVRLKRDVFSNRSAQQVSNRDDNFVQIDVAWPENLSPAERQKLPGQGGGPLRCFFDLADLLRQSGIQWSLQSKKSVTADDR